MTFPIFLIPIILAVVIGLIVWFTVVPFVSFLLKQVQLSNNTAVPLQKFPVIKTPTPTKAQLCNMGAIVCLPEAQKNVTKMNNEGRGNV